MDTLNLKFIKERRKKQRFTLQQAANMLGLSNGSVYYKYESGIYAFKAETLPMLANILSCSISDFFTQNSSKIETKQKSA